MSKWVPAVPVILIVAWIVTSPAPLRAADGEELYRSLHCVACHKPDKKSAGESLATIAQTYGDEAKLLQFFKGESKPLIEPELPVVMQGRMEAIKALPPEDRKALAGYILSFK